jgi:hypothetical protein
VDTLFWAWLPRFVVLVVVVVYVLIDVRKTAVSIRQFPNLKATTAEVTTRSEACGGQCYRQLTT